MDFAEFERSTLGKLAQQIRKTRLTPHPPEQALYIRRMIQAGVITGKVHPNPKPDGTITSISLSITEKGLERLEALQNVEREKKPARRFVKLARDAFFYLLGVLSMALATILARWGEKWF